MASKVSAIGCFTDDWMRGVDVSPSVTRELQLDPSLDRVLFRALHRHSQRLPRLMRRGAQLTTLAAKGRGASPHVVIITHCSGSAHLQTVIRHRPKKR